MKSWIAVDEDLYMLQINWKGKRTIGKESKGINVEKDNNSFNFFFLKREREKEKLHRTAKA